MSEPLPTETSGRPAPAPAAAPGWRLPAWAAVLGLGVLMAGLAAVLAALAATLLEATAAAALATAVVVMPMAALVVLMVRQIEVSKAQVQRQESVDALTGVPNRAHFMALAEREWSRLRRYGGGAALVIVEVDKLARLADSRGADAAGAVMREVARHTGATLRGADAMGRLDGAQLAVWLVQADPTGALDAAERMRERIEALDITWLDQTLRVTLSVGVAVIRPAQQNLAALVADAEAALQAARHNGGNCVRAAPVDPSRLLKIGPGVGDNQAAGPV